MFLLSLSRCLLALFLWNIPILLFADTISVQDDTGQRITFATPAKRIIVLTPHIAEILVTLGAQGRVVGYVKTAGQSVDLPKAEIIGTMHGLNIEKIIRLQPDLIIAWGFMPIAQKMQLEKMQIPVFVSDPRQLVDIVDNIQKIGRLVGFEQSAIRLAAQVYERLLLLQAEYQQRQNVSVFFQVWTSPLMGIGNASILDDAIKICGGRNIFGDQSKSAFSVSPESVIVRNPQVILATLLPEQESVFIQQWRRWSKIAAVKHGHLYIVDVNRLSRPSHLLLEGVDSLCQTMDKARQ